MKKNKTPDRDLAAASAVVIAYTAVLTVGALADSVLIILTASAVFGLVLWTAWRVDQEERYRERTREKLRRRCDDAEAELERWREARGEVQQ